MTPDALHHLCRSDPDLARIIHRVGPCAFQPSPRRPPFESLVRAVANQQLNGRAADTIIARFRALVPARRFPAAADVPVFADDQLRACGFSRAKIASIRDIADKTLRGAIPDSRQCARMTDEEIVARLTEVRGVGRWTAEMLLMFQLGRPDVLPADDFGIRNGFRLMRGLKAMPHAREVLLHGDRWRPHRTTASWYLWRAVELLRPMAS